MSDHWIHTFTVISWAYCTCRISSREWVIVGSILSQSSHEHIVLVASCLGTCERLSSPCFHGRLMIVSCFRISSREWVTIESIRSWLFYWLYSLYDVSCSLWVIVGLLCRQPFTNRIVVVVRHVVCEWLSMFCLLSPLTDSTSLWHLIQQVSGRGICTFSTVSQTVMFVSYHLEGENCRLPDRKAVSDTICCGMPSRSWVIIAIVL